MMVDSSAGGNHLYLVRISAYDGVVTTENMDSSAVGNHVYPVRILYLPMMVL